MKIYLVGGAVRDQLLGYPIKEQDWVVTGASPNTLLKLGYKQVGQDFPVFLHPETHEEYALARVERQSGRGYRGFKFNFDPTVTLEEDLQRRDLTINAMAMNSEGQLIDPYQGKKDLELKILRHVSAAFSEDPVRVLRIARFAARYAHLGFKIANETRALMYEMVRKGEMDYLIPERVWQEWQKSLSEKSPEIFISTLRSCGAAAIIFPEINNLFGIPNPPEPSKEVDSGLRILSNLHKTAKVSNDPLIRFSSLGLEIGKNNTLMQNWPNHVDYFKAGAEEIEILAKRLKIPTKYYKSAIIVSLYHQQIFTLCNNNPNLIVETFEQTDAFRRPEMFQNLLLVCEAVGQFYQKATYEDMNSYENLERWRLLITACSKISVQDILVQGYQGKAIQSALKQKRIETIKFLMETR